MIVQLQTSRRFVSSSTAGRAGGPRAAAGGGPAGAASRPRQRRRRQHRHGAGGGMAAQIIDNIYCITRIMTDNYLLRGRGQKYRSLRSSSFQMR